VWLQPYRVECAGTLRTVVSTVINLALLRVGYIWDATTCGFTFATIALTSYHDLPDLISLNTHTELLIRMRECDSYCTSRTNWCHLAGTFRSISKPKPVNAFDSIGVILAESLEAEPLASAFLEQSAVASLWNLYSTEAAAYE